MHSTASVFLSIIIPAYNESARLPHSLHLLHEYLATREYCYEVIVVNDGSTDDTSGIIASLQQSWPEVRCLTLEHHGKGHAIKQGILASTGEFIFLCDADFSMPPASIGSFLPPVRSDYDIAIATREGEKAVRVDEPAYRHYMGRAFNTLVRVTAVPGIEDTQCGFKCLRAEVARELASVQTIDGWGFDVEYLFLARRKNLRIVEVPITWYYMKSSRIHPIRDSFQMLREVLQIRRNYRKGVYSSLFGSV